MKPRTIVSIRRAFGLSKRDFAAVLNVHLSTVYRWEDGGVTGSPPTGATLAVLRGLHQVIKANGSSEERMAYLKKSIRYGITYLLRQGMSEMAWVHMTYGKSKQGMPRPRAPIGKKLTVDLDRLEEERRQLIAPMPYKVTE